jgi:hypothetical protein
MADRDWFRRGGKAFTTAQPPDSPWASPADEGFRVASVVASPSTGETTAAGLPTRVPSANLVPGSVGGVQSAQQGRHTDGRQQEPGTPARSADAVRERLTNLQRGARQGRAAAAWNYGTDEN